MFLRDAGVDLEPLVHTWHFWMLVLADLKEIIETTDYPGLSP